MVGTSLDEFLPIYWFMSHPTKHRPAYTAGEVDALDLAVVAALLGLGGDDPNDPHGRLTGDLAADSARLAARRFEALRTPSSPVSGDGGHV